jgi:hypothetical protein
MEEMKGRGVIMRRGWIMNWEVGGTRREIVLREQQEQGTSVVKREGGLVLFSGNRTCWLQCISRLHIRPGASLGGLFWALRMLTEAAHYF